MVQPRHFLRAMWSPTRSRQLWGWACSVSANVRRRRLESRRFSSRSCSPTERLDHGAPGSNGNLIGVLRFDVLKSSATHRPNQLDISEQCSERFFPILARAGEIARDPVKYDAICDAHWTGDRGQGVAP